jgi:hypothetical protein
VSRPTNEQVRDALTTARRLLVDVGWIKRDYHTEAGYCLAGAVIAVTPITPGEKEWNSVQVMAFEWLADAHQRLFESDRGIVNYNDDAQTTREDVLALIDQAIAEHRLSTVD